MRFRRRSDLPAELRGPLRDHTDVIPTPLHRPHRSKRNSLTRAASATGTLRLGDSCCSGFSVVPADRCRARSSTSTVGAAARPRSAARTIRPGPSTRESPSAPNRPPGPRVGHRHRLERRPDRPPRRSRRTRRRRRNRTRYSVFDEVVDRASPTDVGWWRYRIPGGGNSNGTASSTACTPRAIAAPSPSSTRTRSGRARRT